MSDKPSSGEKLLYCSFCGKSQHEVRKLIAGPSVFICDECIELCNDIIREETATDKGGKGAKSDLPTPREIRALRDLVRDHLLGVLPAARRGDALLGLGGTVRTLARMHLAAQAGPRRKRHALCLTLADVTALRERIEALPLRKRRRIPGLKAERADIILAGAITVEEVMRFGGYGALTVCKGGVRDGILWQETFTGL